MPFTSISLLNIITATMCCVAGLGSAITILRRDINKESLFFSLFLIGLSAHQIFYAFLLVEGLKELHYPLSTISIAICVTGLYLFSKSLKTKGNITTIDIFLCSLLFLVPLFCIIFRPYIFISEPHGYELQVEPWFLIFYTLFEVSYLAYSVSLLFKMMLTSHSLKIRRKVKIIIVSLILIAISAILTEVVIPIIFLTHITKPVGYLLMGLFMLTMSYAFIEKD
ncbi:MAG: hypothetical protein HWN67_14220 [Candidatus Helarchaeota archaeon]|nr:hypothetical protein [Candidatus Helarchaeota archaeon]